mgnify:CR=1 FL=1
MSILLPILLGLLALCAELFVREALALDSWAPEFLVVLLLFLGTHRGGRAVGIAALLGALADGFKGSPLGLHMLHAVLLTYGAAALANQVRFRGILGNLLLGALGGVLSLFLLALLSRVFLSGTPLGVRIGALIVPQVTLNALLVPLAFPVLEKLEGLLIGRKDSDVL